MTPQIPMQQPTQQPTQQPIVGYFQDEENHWVATLACGHNQHVRHNPPLVSRPWVLTQTGRDEKIGVLLSCKKCDDHAPRDWLTN